MDSQTWDQLTKIIWTPHQYRAQGKNSMDIKNVYNNIEYVSNYGDCNLIRPYSCLPLHEKKLWVLTIMFPWSFSSSIILEYKYLQLPCQLPFYGPDKWNLCKIINGTSVLQVCQHPCSWKILMENSIQKYTCAHPSSYTCSSPRRAVRSHYLVCSENYLLIVGIWPSLNKEFELIFDLNALMVRAFIVRTCPLTYTAR